MPTSPSAGCPPPPPPLRQLAEDALWGRHHGSLMLHPLELMYGDPHYVAHLLLISGCSIFLVRRVRLFHALVHGCRYCARLLSRGRGLELFAHAEEIPRYWTHFGLLAPGRAKLTCTCPADRGHCRFSWYFRAPRLSAGLANPLVCRAPGLPREFYPCQCGQGSCRYCLLPDPGLDATFIRACR